MNSEQIAKLDTIQDDTQIFKVVSAMPKALHLEALNYLLADLDPEQAVEDLKDWYFLNPFYWRPVVTLLIERAALDRAFIQTIITNVADSHIFHNSILVSVAEMYPDKEPKLSNLLKLSKYRLLKYWAWFCSLDDTKIIICEIFEEYDQKTKTNYKTSLNDYDDYARIRLLLENLEKKYLYKELQF